MLGGIGKLTLLLNALLVLMVLLWQAATIDASPILTNNNNNNDDDLAKSNEDASYLSAIDVNQKGALIVKRSLHSLVGQPSLIDPLRHRRLRKKLSFRKLNDSPSIFRSAGTDKNDLRAAKRIQTAVADRLKRFRMLDPDEFQEMLNSWSHQVPDHSIKELDNMDTIGGMQLENYWLRK